MLTLKRVDVRPVVVPLKRHIVSRVGFFDEWPLILIDLYTEEGIVGRSYLAPYLKRSPRYIVPAIYDLADARKGHVIAPFDDFEGGRSALHFVGLEGISLIAVSGLDMAAWDALAKAAGLPLAVLLGGSLAPVQGRMYAEARRVVRSGGTFAIYDVLQGEGGEVVYPVPWAREPSISFLATPDEMSELLHDAGFEIVDRRDTTSEGLTWFSDVAEHIRETGSPALGFHVLMGEEFALMARNQLRNLEENRVALAEIICRAA